jgi:molybdenum cofactor biosynthesis enzyme MoaA
VTQLDPVPGGIRLHTAEHPGVAVDCPSTHADRSACARAERLSFHIEEADVGAHRPPRPERVQGRDAERIPHSRAGATVAPRRRPTDVTHATAVVRRPRHPRSPLRDLRISVTDRCNFRCVYCMPREVFGRDYAFLERHELLTFEEIERIARAALANGVRKLRLTGGEPLLRRGIEDLVARLAALRTLDGTKPEIALTTNGSALAVKAEALKDAGVDRVTVSIDSLDDQLFRRMNDVEFPVARVLQGIDAAQAAGMPVKLNTVVKRGLNDGEILSLAEHFRGTGHVLRFIEYMDVGATNGWSLDEVVPRRRSWRRSMRASRSSPSLPPPARPRSAGAMSTDPARSA